MELFGVLITGANRGIGLEFVKQLANAPKPPKHIFATYRSLDTTKELEVIQNTAPSDVQVHLVKLDVRSSEDLNDLRNFVDNKVGEKGLTMLINNAGIAKSEIFPNVTAENLNMHFQVNTVGPILVAQALLPLLKRAASQSPDSGMRFSKAGMLNMSSFLGSTENTGVEFPDDLDDPSYKISKELEQIQKCAPSDVQVHLVKFDARNGEDISNLKTFVDNAVGEKGLTLLINNAGISEAQQFPNLTSENLNKHFEVNTVGALLVAQAFLPLLKKAASFQSPDSGMTFSRAGILNMSSTAASIVYTGVQFTVDLPFASYKISKTALNMAMRVMAATQKNDKILIVNMCPGWVRTDMSEGQGEISVEESISEMLHTICKLDETHHGAFVDRFGNPIPW